MRLHMQSFRVTESEAQAIKQCAEREHLSASELLRKALAAYLNPPAPSKPKRAAARRGRENSVSEVALTQP